MDRATVERIGSRVGEYGLVVDHLGQWNLIRIEGLRQPNDRHDYRITGKLHFSNPIPKGLRPVDGLPPRIRDARWYVPPEIIYGVVTKSEIEDVVERIRDSYSDLVAARERFRVAMKLSFDV